MLQKYKMLHSKTWENMFILSKTTGIKLIQQDIWIKNLVFQELYGRT